MTYRTFVNVLAIAIALSLTLNAHPDAITISGTAKWTASDDATHPAREIKVQLFDSNPLTGDTFIGDAITNESGEYSIPLDTDGFDDDLDLYIKLITEGPLHKTYTAGGATGGDLHQFDSAVMPNVTASKTFDVTTPKGTETGQAFGVHDAVFTANKYTSMVRGTFPTLTPKGLTVEFPVAPSGSFYLSSEKELNIAENRATAWDVIHHEYGHFLQDIDALDDSPGGAHTLNVSSIPGRGKDDGTKIAWSEGLATYLGIAVQDLAKAHLPAVPTTGDDIYHALNSTDATKSFSSSLESNIDRPDGEGDEVAVSRILWDIADDKADKYASGHSDIIKIGHKALYEILNTKIADLDTLDDVWDHFHDNPADLGLTGSDDYKRAVLGAVFEEYTVSPIPFLIPIFFDKEGAAPSFSWIRSNDVANDKFQVLIFNSDFTDKLIAHDVVGDVDNYMLTAAQWMTLKDAETEDFQVVITGTDSAAPSTGAYWSSSHAFSIPEPTSLLLLTLTALPLLKRRQTPTPVS